MLPSIHSSQRIDTTGWVFGARNEARRKVSNLIAAILEVGLEPAIAKPVSWSHILGALHLANATVVGRSESFCEFVQKQIGVGCLISKILRHTSESMAIIWCWSVRR